eukprot:10890976-Prorocentrum_lima.AAC.1
MHRGLLEGAPESPVLFTLVTDAVFAPLEEEWKRKGWGWGMDGLHIAAVIYADDIFLLSRDARTLEKMTADTKRALATEGLSINDKKCSYATTDDTTTTPLRVG